MIVAVIEQDIVKLGKLIAESKSERHKTSTVQGLYTTAIARYVAEVMASIASIYRCSAALTVDESGAGQTEWLVVQGLCEMSRIERESIVRELRKQIACDSFAKDVVTTHVDEYSTHPVEAGNRDAPKIPDKK